MDLSRVIERYDDMLPDALEIEWRGEAVEDMDDATLLMFMEHLQIVTQYLAHRLTGAGVGEGFN